MFYEPEKMITDWNTPPSNQVMHPHAERSQHLRILEAILFAATEPVSLEKFGNTFPKALTLRGCWTTCARIMRTVA